MPTSSLIFTHGKRYKFKKHNNKKRKPYRGFRIEKKLYRFDDKKNQLQERLSPWV